MHCSYPPSVLFCIFIHIFIKGSCNLYLHNYRYWNYILASDVFSPLVMITIDMLTHKAVSITCQIEFFKMSHNRSPASVPQTQTPIILSCGNKLSCHTYHLLLINVTCSTWANTSTGFCHFAACIWMSWPNYSFWVMLNACTLHAYTFII